MRIDKFICDTINITRTQAKNKISSGNVFVNGSAVKSSSLQINENVDEVCVDGNLLTYRKYVYIMMNKPEGVLSATSDKTCKTAIDLLNDEDKRHDLFIAGRLDKNTTGFLLITNDGDFAHSILSPKKHIYKTYFVTLKYDDFSGYADMFSKGIVIDGGYKCKPAELFGVEKNTCYLKISEGKFHQIKRMFSTLGNEIVALHRVAMGDLQLDNSLKPGDYRYLSAKELDSFLCKITKNDPSTISRAEN